MNTKILYNMSDIMMGKGMRKILVASVLMGSFIGIANADTVVNDVAKIAATSYVSTAVQTRVSAEGVLKNGSNNVQNTGFVSDVDITGEGLDKKITVTKTALKDADSGSGNVVKNITVTANNQIHVEKSNVEIPVGSRSSTSYTPIWVE
ncbi:MAG: hypothetical protein IKN73_00020 [Alphaproteobacteria bacterium]|nr:hypothetical protein [Alphaproteobacteria bacterium]